MHTTLFTELDTYVTSLAAEFDRITEGRKATLRQLGSHIQKTQAQGRLAYFTVICTHNSRRSHLGQLWLQTAAAYCGLSHVRTYSGGTEATAFHPHAVAALRRAGFAIHSQNESANPKYKVAVAEGLVIADVYSKRFDALGNPTADFWAVMVCSDADQHCPVIKGAERRISLPYEDPKAYDGTPEEADRYDACCRQIAREMMYAVNAGSG